MVKWFKRLEDWVLLKTFHVPDFRKRGIFFRFLIVFALIFLRFFYDDFISLNGEWFLLIDVVLFFFALNLVSQYVRIIVISSYRKRNKLKKDYYDNFTIGLDSILIILTIVIFFGWLLFYLDINFLDFLTIFALFFAGLAWVFERSYCKCY